MYGIHLPSQKTAKSDKLKPAKTSEWYISKPLVIIENRFFFLLLLLLTDREIKFDLMLMLTWCDVKGNFSPWFFTCTKKNNIPCNILSRLSRLCSSKYMMHFSLLYYYQSLNYLQSEQESKNKGENLFHTGKHSKITFKRTVHLKRIIK